MALIPLPSPSRLPPSLVSELRFAFWDTGALLPAHLLRSTTTPPPRSSAWNGGTGRGGGGGGVGSHSGVHPPGVTPCRGHEESQLGEAAEPLPDRGLCLLHQKLQMLQLCLHRWGGAAEAAGRACPRVSVLLTAISLSLDLKPSVKVSTCS